MKLLFFGSGFFYFADQLEILHSIWVPLAIVLAVVFEIAFYFLKEFQKTKLKG